MTGKKFYLTTAIDYANGDPHFGHALEKIGADAIARAVEGARLYNDLRRRADVVVTPPERPAAASVTAVPRSLASSLSPAVAGMLLTTSFAGLHGTQRARSTGKS